MPVKVNNFYVPKIDSVCIIMHIEDIEIVDRTYFDKLITICESTSEIVEEKEGRPVSKQTKHGITFRMSAKMNHKEIHLEKPTNQFKVFLSAKHLKGKYFEGINEENADLIRQEINAQEIVNIPKKVFFDAEWRDLDFCFDFDMPLDVFEEVVVDRLPKMAQFRKGKDVFCQYKQKGNAGVDFNTRKGKQSDYPSRPFLKFYYKSLELEHNSFEFTDAYLNDFDLSNIARCEVNIKGRKSKKHWGLGGYKTFKHILRFDATMLFKQVGSSWFLPKVYSPSKSGLIHYEILLNEFIQNTDINTINMYLNFACQRVTRREQRGKMRATVNKLLDPEKMANHEYKRLEHAKKLDDFLGLIKEVENTDL